MYHISLKELDENELIFIPRIPETASPVENKTIPRICVSSSIQGCVDAILSCHIHPELEKCRYFDKEELFLYVYVPAEELQFSDIFDTETLNKMKYVHDSERTNECWILRPVNMKLQKVLRVTNVKESFGWLKFADFDLEEFPFKITFEEI